MHIYCGKSANGSDIHEFKGFPTSPNGWFWGSNPISEAEEKQMDRDANFRRPGRRRIKAKKLC